MIVDAGHVHGVVTRTIRVTVETVESALGFEEWAIAAIGAIDAAVALGHDIHLAHHDHFVHCHDSVDVRPIAYAQGGVQDVKAVPVTNQVVLSLAWGQQAAWVT